VEYAINETRLLAHFVLVMVLPESKKGGWSSSWTTILRTASPENSTSSRSAVAAMPGPSASSCLATIDDID